mgnify:CR=1 FL=1
MSLVVKCSNHGKLSNLLYLLNNILIVELTHVICENVQDIELYEAPVPYIYGTKRNL